MEITHKISHQNYDRGFKGALTLFESQTLDFVSLEAKKHMYCRYFNDVRSPPNNHSGFISV